jgi:hypothetical protein
VSALLQAPPMWYFGTAFGISTVEFWDARRYFAFGENCVSFFIWLDSGTW